MNRRQLLKLLISGAVGHTLDLDRLLWIPNTKTIFLPSPKLDVSLFGIPYHQSNASTGQWLGFSRGDYVTKEIVSLIQLLETDKRNT